MNIKKSRLHKIAATATAFCVAFTQVAIAAPAFSVSTHEVSLPDTLRLDQAMQISVPSAVATIDKLIPGSGKTIFHIQTAHGQYQAEKQIETLLTHLEQNYGVETLLMEGASQPLNPEIINFFPEDRKTTLEAVDAFVRHSVISGPEVFLLNSGKAKGLGIEDEAAYEQNLQDFAAVISARDSSSQFLSDLEQGIERLAALYLSSDARSFLKQVERKETGDVPFDIYLQQLKLAAEKHAGINLTDASWQLLWPMLTRVFTIEKLEKKIDAAAFKKQKEDFLKAVKPSLSREIYSEVEKLLNLKDLSAKLPDPETSALFESLVRSLPDNFNYDRFSSVTAFCGLLMLKSQLQIETLSDEISRIEDKIADKLAETKNAKALVSVLKDYRLLKKLFALELLPTDFDKLSSTSIQPSQIIEKLKGINGNARAKEITFTNASELNFLYDKAVRFYEGARLRDTKMLERIEEQLDATGADKVAVVTGGFHSGPFAKYFEERGYSYALMTPKLTAIDAQGRQNYLNVMQAWASAPKDATASNGAEIAASTIHPRPANPGILMRLASRFLNSDLFQRFQGRYMPRFATGAVIAGGVIAVPMNVAAQAQAVPPAPAPIVAKVKQPVVLPMSVESQELFNRIKKILEAKPIGSSKKEKEKNAAEKIDGLKELKGSSAKVYVTLILASLAADPKENADVRFESVIQLAEIFKGWSVPPSASERVVDVALSLLKEPALEFDAAKLMEILLLPDTSLSPTKRASAQKSFDEWVDKKTKERAKIIKTAEKGLTEVGNVGSYHTQIMALKALLQQAGITKQEVLDIVGLLGRFLTEPSNAARANRETNNVFNTITTLEVTQSLDAVPYLEKYIRTPDPRETAKATRDSQARDAINSIRIKNGLPPAAARSESRNLELLKMMVEGAIVTGVMVLPTEAISQAPAVPPAPAPIVASAKKALGPLAPSQLAELNLQKKDLTNAVLRKPTLTGNSKKAIEARAALLEEKLKAIESAKSSPFYPYFLESFADVAAGPYSSNFAKFKDTEIEIRNRALNEIYVIYLENKIDLQTTTNVLGYLFAIAGWERGRPVIDRDKRDHRWSSLRESYSLVIRLISGSPEAAGLSPLGRDLLSQVITIIDAEEKAELAAAFEKEKKEALKLVKELEDNPGYVYRNDHIEKIRIFVESYRAQLDLDTAKRIRVLAETILLKPVDAIDAKSGNLTKLFAINLLSELGSLDSIPAMERAANGVLTNLKAGNIDLPILTKARIDKIKSAPRSEARSPVMNVGSVELEGFKFELSADGELSVTYAGETYDLGEAVLAYSVVGKFAAVRRASSLELFALDETGPRSMLYTDKIQAQDIRFVRSADFESKLAAIPLWMNYQIFGNVMVVVGAADGDGDRQVSIYNLVTGELLETHFINNIKISFETDQPTLTGKEDGNAVSLPLPMVDEAGQVQQRSEARRTYEAAYVQSLFSDVSRLDAALTSFVKGQAGEYWSRVALNPKKGAGAPAIVVENKAGSFADQLMAAAKAAGVADMPLAEFAAYAIANYASFELTTGAYTDVASAAYRSEVSASAEEEPQSPAVSTVSPTSDDIEKGVAIFKGELGASGVVRPVRLTNSEDMQGRIVREWSPEERVRLAVKGAQIDVQGALGFASPIAGASSRMPIKEAPDGIDFMVDEVHGEGHELQGKAAVPVGREASGKAYSYLGLMLSNISAVGKWLRSIFPDAKPSSVILMTNPDYDDEPGKEIRRNGLYGLEASQFVTHGGKIGYYQDLAPKFYLNESQVRQVHKLILDKNAKSPEDRARLEAELAPILEDSLAKVRQIETAIATGHPEAVVHPSEVDPAGHAEFAHQMVSKGVLLDLIDRGVTYIPFRNIDNSAGVYDENFYAMLGYMTEQGLDALYVVAPRGKGMKGGALMVDENGSFLIAEDPTIDAEWKKIVAGFKSDGFTREVEVKKLTGDVSVEKVPDAWVTRLEQLMDEKGFVEIESTTLSYKSEKIITKEDLRALLKTAEEKEDARIAVFKNEQGDLRVVRKVTSADAPTINAASPIVTVQYLAAIYRTEGQSFDQFVAEMRQAREDGTLEAIAARGRSKMPLLLDPKPARDKSVIGLVKREGNFHEATGVMPADIRIGAVQVSSFRDVDLDAFQKMDLDGQVQYLRSLAFQFLATKQWKGAAESFQANQAFYPALIAMGLDPSKMFSPEFEEAFKVALRSEARQYVVADFDGLNEGDNLETVVLPRFINRFNDSALKRDIDVNTTPLIVTVETQSGAQVQITVPNFTAHFTSEGLSRAIWNASRTEANGIPVVDKPEDLAFGSWLKSLRVEIATVPSRSTAPVTPVTTPRSEARLNAEQVETIKTLLAQFTLGILSLEKAKLALNELDGEQIRQVAAEVLGVELQVDETQEAGALLDQLLNFAGNADLGFGRVLTERAQGDTVDATRTQNKPVLVTAASLRYLAKGNARAAVALVEQMEALNVSIVVSMGDDDKKAFFDDLVRDLTKQQSGFSGSQDDMIKMLGKVLDRRNTAELTDFAAKAKVSGQQFAKLDLGLPSDAELSRLDGGYAFELKNGNASLSGKDLWAVAVVGALLPRAVATVENLEAAQAAEKLLEFFNSQQNMGLTFQGGVFKFGTIETLLQAIVTAQYIEIMA